MKDHWDSHVSFHQHENVNFWAALGVKPDLGPLFNVHSNLPSFIPDRERRGGGRRRTSSQNLKLPGGTICFYGTKHWLRINNKRFTKFPYLPCCSARDPAAKQAALARQGRALLGTGCDPQNHIRAGGKHILKHIRAYTSSACPARVCVITFFNNRHATLKIKHYISQNKKASGHVPLFLLIGKYTMRCILFILLYDQPSETGHFKLWHNDTWPEGQTHFRAGL